MILIWKNSVAKTNCNHPNQIIMLNVRSSPFVDGNIVDFLLIFSEIFKFFTLHGLPIFCRPCQARNRNKTFRNIQVLCYKNILNFFFKNTNNTQKYKKKQIQKYKSTKIQKYKNTKIQKYKNKQIQKYKNTKIQKYNNITIQKYKNYVEN